jgi:hypothetical protein
LENTPGNSCAGEATGGYTSAESFEFGFEFDFSADSSNAAGAGVEGVAEMTESNSPTHRLTAAHTRAHEGNRPLARGFGALASPDVGTVEPLKQALNSNTALVEFKCFTRYFAP